MYSPRLYKYRDSYVIYKPTVRFGITYTHSFGTDKHTRRFRPFPPNIYLFSPKNQLFSPIQRITTQ